MTSLDKYSIVNIFYLFIICVWHSIVGTFWEKERAIIIDRIFLCIFGFIFIIIQFVYGMWMYFARAQVRVLDKEEKRVLLEINKRLEIIC
jgi:hypothetical protein